MTNRRGNPKAPNPRRRKSRIRKMNRCRRRFRQKNRGNSRNRESWRKEKTYPGQESDRGQSEDLEVELEDIIEKKDEGAEALHTLPIVGEMTDGQGANDDIGAARQAEHGIRRGRHRRRRGSQPHHPLRKHPLRRECLHPHRRRLCLARTGQRLHRRTRSHRHRRSPRAQRRRRFGHLRRLLALGHHFHKCLLTTTPHTQPPPYT